MKHLIRRSRLKHLLLLTSVSVGVLAAATPAGLKGLMYVGTLDHKLLVITEDSGDVIGEIPLGGIPRTTVLSPDRT